MAGNALQMPLMCPANLLNTVLPAPARGLKNHLEIHPLGENSLWNLTDNTEYFIRDDRTFLFQVPPPHHPACHVSPLPFPIFFSPRLTTSHGHITAIPLSLQADLGSARCPVVMLSSSLANHI